MNLMARVSGFGGTMKSSLVMPVGNTILSSDNVTSRDGTLLEDNICDILWSACVSGKLVFTAAANNTRVVTGSSQGL